MVEGQLELYCFFTCNPLLWYGRDGACQRTDYGYVNGGYVLFYREGWIYIAV